MLQLSQLQEELEAEWKGKCEQMMASAKEHHGRELAEVTEQRDALRDKLMQLEEKVGERLVPSEQLRLTKASFLGFFPQQVVALKQSRDSEEQSGQAEELQALQGKVRSTTPRSNMLTSRS